MLREIRIRDASGIYRVMYAAKFEEAIYALHCFQKKTQVTGKQDKAIAAVRYRAVLNARFAPDEAKRLQAASRKQINDTRLLKQELMQELSVWIAKHHLKQAEAAEIPMVSRPRVSDVVNKKTAKFTIDTLVEMLSRIGKPVKLAIS
jgi:predicted XRE-type DNA-binding protein